MVDVIQDAPIISTNSRIRHPESFEVGRGSIVDDFCYFSARIKLGSYCHVASGCSIAGGATWLFTLGDYSSLSSGVKVWCASDDFVRDLITIVPEDFGEIKENLIAGDVFVERYTAVGANSVVMPRNHIPEGCTIGALSFVPAAFPFEPWTVYAGIPIKAVRKRDRPSVLRQAERFEEAIRARRSL